MDSFRTEGGGHPDLAGTAYKVKTKRCKSLALLKQIVNVAKYHGFLIHEVKEKCSETLSIKYVTMHSP